MKYVPPVGGTTDQSYVDGDPSTGVEGSPVPAAAIEHPMREIVAIIVAAGLLPATNVLTQLRDALYALFGRLGAANVWTKGQSGAESALPATAGTVTIDLAQSNNWGGTLTGNIVLVNPSSMPVGQSGVIRLVNGTPPVTIAYGSYWKPVDGATLPALTAVTAACDDLVYYVESATRIIVGRVGGSL